MYDIGKRRAWMIWVAAMSVYVLGVFNRSSLGVAGLMASDRFGIEATELAFFTVLQLLVYAGMQVPVGVLLDRFGSRTMLLAGSVLMSGGQLIFAFANTFELAVLGRAVLGAGDAMIFVSVIRLVSMWFLVRQAPMITQLTGQTGQLGAVAAAAPLTLALHHLGWTRTFAAASCLGLVLMVLVACLVKDSPYRRGEVAQVKLAALARSVRLVWGNPGTRLGMWSHFTSQFSMTVFTLLWGFPFLVQGQGLSPEVAGTLLMVMTGWVLLSGPVLGAAVARWPYYRSWIVIGVVGTMATLWALVLLRSTPAPMWLLVPMILATATGGPASMVGFDLARSFTPATAVGRANGIVNVGGFTAALLTMGLIGVVLDLHSSGGVARYDLSDFRWALSVQFVFWGLGVVQVLRYRRKGIAHLQRLHPEGLAGMKAGVPFAHPGIGDSEGV